MARPNKPNSWLAGIGSVRNAAAQIGSAHGTTIEVETLSYEGGREVNLYTPDGWTFKATECHTAINTGKTWKGAAAEAIKVLEAGLEPEPAAAPIFR